ncbi:MAG: hypothetical protein D3906_14220 [Candidatus Electrothrix sp. AUS1_2]|nr:hypothetical protein [Candidatus Electrothrix sp. AUS1_2]
MKERIQERNSKYIRSKGISIISFIWAFLWISAMSPLPSSAEDSKTVSYKKCSSKQEAGDTCLLKPDKVRPTQANVGVLEVQCKYNKFTEKNGDEMDYLDDWQHHVPTVIGPDGNFYITDHHHMTAALWLTQKQGQHTGRHLRIDVLKNFYDPDLKQPPTEQQMDSFWDYMEKNNFVYLRNNGSRITWHELPTSISGLTDDPYRSQAGFQKDDSLQGFIKPINNAMFFLEFKWGGLLRDHQVLAERLADIPSCRLSADKDDLWYNGKGSCARQADLQQEKLAQSFRIITSADAGKAMLPQCMNSMEGVNQLCGYNKNAAYPYPDGAEITHKCNIKAASD